MRQREIGRAGWGRTASCALIGIVYFLPVLWIVLTAFKTPRDALTPTLDNFAAVFARVYYRGGEVLDTGFDLYFVNSVVVSGASVGLALVLGTAAAYGFSRWPLRGNDTYLLVILTTRMLPPIILIIPIFLMFRLSGLAGSYLGIILLYTAFNLPFAVWIMKSFFDELPREVEDAARIDGSSERRVFFRVCLPAGQGRRRRDRDPWPHLDVERVPDGAAPDRAGDADRAGRHGRESRRRHRRGVGASRGDRDAVPDTGRARDVRPAKPASPGRHIRHDQAPASFPIAAAPAPARAAADRTCGRRV